MKTDLFKLDVSTGISLNELCFLRKLPILCRFSNVYKCIYLHRNIQGNLLRYFIILLVSMVIVIIFDVRVLSALLLLIRLTTRGFILYFIVLVLLIFSVLTYDYLVLYL